MTKECVIKGNHVYCDPENINQSDAQSDATEYTHSCNLNEANNFHISISTGDHTIELNDGHPGQAGMIVINYTADPGATSIALSTSTQNRNILYPGGSTITFTNTKDSYDVLSYYMYDNEKIIVACNKDFKGVYS